MAYIVYSSTQPCQHLYMYVHVHEYVLCVYLSYKCMGVHHTYMYTTMRVGVHACVYGCRFVYMYTYNGRVCAPNGYMCAINSTLHTHVLYMSVQVVETGRNAMS